MTQVDNKRAISLLPAATEIVAALGLMDQLVGVSHECDFPEEANNKPRITHCQIHEAGMPSKEVDQWVTSNLENSGTLYTMDEELIRELAPAIIFTQKLCDVCAVDYGSVAKFAYTLPTSPEVVNLEPLSLEDIFNDIKKVANALGHPMLAERLIERLMSRVEHVKKTLANVSHRPICYLMEWIDPPFASGHWGPELVELAGGLEPLGKKREDSKRIAWEDVLRVKPEIVVIACCGYSIERTLRDLPILTQYPQWSSLPAVQNEQIFVVDGSAYFSRPGPRIVDSLEILASIIHPELFKATHPYQNVSKLCKV